MGATLIGIDGHVIGQRLCSVAKKSVQWPSEFDEWGPENCYWDKVYAVNASKKPVLQNLGVELLGWHGQANPGRG